MEKCDFKEWLMEELRDNPQACVDYINDVKEEGDIRAYLLAIKDVIDANGGMSEIARKTKLSRGSMYKALSGARYPRIDTIDKIMNSIGIDTSYSVRK